jgi:hypothetical protein
MTSAEYVQQVVNKVLDKFVTIGDVAQRAEKIKDEANQFYKGLHTNIRSLLTETIVCFR